VLPHLPPPKRNPAHDTGSRSPILAHGGSSHLDYYCHRWQYTGVTYREGIWRGSVGNGSIGVVGGHGAISGPLPTVAGGWSPWPHQANGSPHRTPM
jgi:hypothetical protein